MYNFKLADGQKVKLIITAQQKYFGNPTDSTFIYLYKQNNFFESFI